MLVMETDSGAKTDTKLLAEFARSGSPEVFAELVRRHTDMVYAACRRVLADPGAAEDAAQASFLVLYQKARGLPAGTQLANWLYRVAEFSACEMRRARQRRARHEEEAMTRHREAAPVTDEWEDVRPHLDSALVGMPSKLREVLVLHYLQGLAMSEVAEALGCSEGAIKMRLSRGLHRLRERLRRAGLFVPAVSLTAFLSERAVEAAPRELAAGITKACLAKAASAAAGAVAKHVAAKLFWTPIKVVALAGGLAAAVLLPAVHLGLRTEVPVENPTPAAVSPMSAGVVASPEAEDHDGLHLDVPSLWRFDRKGSLIDHPMRRFPTRVEVPFARPEEPHFCMFGLIHERSWALGPQAVSLRAAFRYAPHASRAASFQLFASFDPQRTWDVGKQPFLNLLAMQLGGNVQTRASNLNAKNQEVFDMRSFAPGRHVVELAVSGREWASYLDGQLLYRGTHGYAGERVQFGMGFVTEPDPEVTLTVDEVRVGPVTIREAKVLPDDF